HRQRPPRGSVQPVLSESAETALRDGDAPHAALSDKTLCVLSESAETALRDGDAPHPALSDKTLCVSAPIVRQKDVYPAFGRYVPLLAAVLLLAAFGPVPLLALFVEPAHWLGGEPPDDVRGRGIRRGVGSPAPSRPGQPGSS